MVRSSASGSRPRRLNSRIAGDESLDAIGGELEEQIIARGKIQVDGTDGDLGLARDHLDSGALEAMLREYGRGGLEDGLSAGVALAPFAFLYAHR